MKKLKTWIYRVRLQLVTVLFIWITLFLIIKSEKKWMFESCIESDVTGYYGYLPALFVHHDLQLNYYRDSLLVHRWQFFPETDAEGHRYFKYTMGMSYLYLPVFAMATAYANISGYPVDGYSKPYQRYIQFSSWMYIVLGLWFLWKYLAFFFSRVTVALTLLLVVFGTNLFYYITGEAALPHAFDFTLYALLMYFSHAQALFPSMKKMVVIGLVFSLLVLIRPVNLLAGFVFCLPYITGVASWKNQWTFLVKKKITFILFFLVAAVVILPQLFYWKYVTGHWLLYTYGQETFDFAHPHMIDGLISYRKGWLVYTPLWLLLIPGFYFLYKKNARLGISIFLFFVLYLYVVFSWQTWYYGGSFGCRAMVDIYALLCIPLAALLQELVRWWVYYKIFFVILVVGFIHLNFFQTYQYKHKIIHWSAMDKETYWLVFGKESVTKQEWHHLQEKWAMNEKLNP